MIARDDRRGEGRVRTCEDHPSVEIALVDHEVEIRDKGGRLGLWGGEVRIAIGQTPMRYFWFFFFFSFSLFLTFSFFSAGFLAFFVSPFILSSLLEPVCPGPVVVRPVKRLSYCQAFSNRQGSEPRGKRVRLGRSMRRSTTKVDQRPSRCWSGNGR